MAQVNAVQAAEADIQITVDHTAVEPIKINDVFEFIVTAANIGPDAVSTNSLLSLSNNLDIQTSDCHGWIISNTVLWTSGFLEPNGQFSCRIEVIARHTGPYRIDGHIGFGSQGLDDDPNPSNNDTSLVVRGWVIPVTAWSWVAMVMLLVFMTSLVHCKKITRLQSSKGWRRLFAVD